MLAIVHQVIPEGVYLLFKFQGGMMTDNAESEVQGESQLSQEDIDAMLRRLRRAHGQLAGVMRMVESRRNAADVITQLAAVSKAVNRAGFHLLSAELRQCLQRPGSGHNDIVALERMFTSLG